MGIALDLVGQRFGQLKVLGLSKIKKYGYRCWLCICDCGKETVVPTSALRSGNTKSCGCIKKNVLGWSTTKHGMHGTYLYTTWKGIRNRCNNKQGRTYHLWGGRGIKMCREWNDFLAFVKYINEQLGPKPSSKHSLDRKDNNGDYEPGNLRWATQAEQNANSRRHGKVQ